MKYLLIVFLILQNFYLYAKEYNYYAREKEGKNELYIKCDKKFESCFSNAVINGKIIVVQDFVTRKSYVKFIGNNIGRLTMSCGSPCSYSTFIDFKTKKISKVYYLVILVDTLNKLVLYSGEDDNKLKLSEMFSKKEVNINRNFSKINPIFSAIDTKDSQFLPDKKLKLDYSSGPHYDTKVEVIDLKELGF